MSLSPESPAKISPLTAIDICEDIWAGTIQYAQEAGYSRNPMVTMMIWSGLFQTARSDLDRYHISDAVLKEFIPTFSKIYNIGLDQVDFLSEVKQKMETFLGIVSEDMNDLRSDMELLVFLGLVEKVNEQLGTKSDDLTIMDRIRRFQSTSSLLSSHIYHIVHQIDNEMLLQFQPLPSARVKAAPTPAPPATAPVQPKKESSGDIYIILFSAIVLFVLICGLLIQKAANGQPASTPAVSETIRPPIKPVARPATGILTKTNMSDSVAPFEVTAPNSSDCYCVLRSTTKPTRSVRFYVRAGSSCEILVPVGTYELYHATGSEWYGIKYLFGDDTLYSKCDDTFEFTEEAAGYSGWTIELQLQSGGNLDSHSIDAEDFP